MNRRATLAMTTALCLAVGLSASDSLAQQKSLKEQLVGTWTLVSSDQVRPDGSTLKQFGANPKGINVFDANDRFFLMIASADNSKIVSNNLSKTNSEEGGGLIVESIAYYGTYTVNEAEKVAILHLEASTFPHPAGAPWWVRAVRQSYRAHDVCETAHRLVEVTEAKTKAPRKPGRSQKKF